MPVSPFATRAYDAVAPGLPETLAVNVYVSPTPAGPTKFSMVQRWGLKAAVVVGTGPVRGMLQQPGLFLGDRFVVSGSVLYRGASSLGVVSTSGVARMACSDVQLGVVDGGKFWIYDGSSLTWVENDKTGDPLPFFIGVIFIAQRFVLLCADGTFYWSDVDDGTQIDGLSFANAESSPDGAVDIVKLGEEFAIAGGSTVEWWFITGDPDAPFQRSANRTHARGCGAQGSVVQADNTVIFVGDDRIVYRSGMIPTPISTHGIEHRLSLCSDLAAATAFTVTFAGHPFYVLNIPGQGSFAYDFSTKEWAEWASYGRTTFRGAWGVMNQGVPVIGDAVSGQIWTLDADTCADGSDPLVRLASFFLPQPFGVARLDNVTLMGSRGVGVLGESPDPVAELRVSTNGVGDWGEWRERSLGAQGQRNTRATWRGLGRIVGPGAFGQVRVSDPVNVAFAGIVWNEQRP